MKEKPKRIWVNQDFSNFLYQNLLVAREKNPRLTFLEFQTALTKALNNVQINVELSYEPQNIKRGKRSHMRDDVKISRYAKKIIEGL
jgi:hypothetical protein